MYYVSGIQYKEMNAKLLAKGTKADVIHFLT